MSEEKIEYIDTSAPYVSFLSQKGVGEIRRRLASTIKETDFSPGEIDKLRTYVIALNAHTMFLKQEKSKIPGALAMPRAWMQKEHPEVIEIEQEIIQSTRARGIDINTRPYKTVVELMLVDNLKELGKDIKLPGFLQQLKERLNK